MRRGLGAVVVLTIFAAGSGSAGAGDDPAPFRPPPDPRDLGAERVEWSGMYVNGERVGWAREGLRRTGGGAAGAYVVTRAFWMTLPMAREPFVVDWSEQRTFDVLPPYGLRAARRVEVAAGHVRVLEAVRAGDGFAVAGTADGVRRRRPSVEGMFTLADELALRTWCRGPRRVGDRVEIATFELEEESLTGMSARVRDVVRPRGGAPVYEVVTVADDGSECQMTVDASGRIRRMSLDGEFEVRAATEAEARGWGPGEGRSPAVVASVDRPLGDPRFVTRLVLEVEGGAAAGLRDGLRQRVRRERDGGPAVVTLGATGGRSSVGEDEVRRALEETPEFPSRRPEVQALAARAVGAATDPAEQVARLLGFVDEFVVDAEVTDRVSVARLVEVPRGSGAEHAALFVTLARAVGVPARPVVGVAYLGDDAAGFGGHTWAEVALGGAWLAVDPLWRQTTVDATHVVFAPERPAPPSGPPVFRVREVTSSPR